MKWLDRAAFTLPIYIGLATNKDKLTKEMKNLGGPAQLGVNDGAGATTNFVSNNVGETCAIVCLFDYKGFDLEQIHSLLVHEAVHIFQEVKEKMGEQIPSKEFEAWTIQKISQDLMYEFKKQTRKKRK